MRQTPELCHGDIVIQARDGVHTALVVGRDDVEGVAGTAVEAHRRLNVALWRVHWDREEVRRRAWRQLRHTLRRSLGLPTWLPTRVFKWRVLWLLGHREACERFEALVREVADECDAANDMRPGRARRLDWGDLALIVEGRWQARRLEARRDDTIAGMTRSIEEAND